MADHEHLEAFTYRYNDERRGTYCSAVVKAGRKREMRKNCDGDPIYERPVRVEVSASPTGRSVQVWVNGERVWPPPDSGRSAT
jgi:hypothetical protein